MWWLAAAARQPGARAPLCRDLWSGTAAWTEAVRCIAVVWIRFDPNARKIDKSPKWRKICHRWSQKRVSRGKASGRRLSPGGPLRREARMTSDFRRHWQVALATLLIWCSAGLLGSIVQAADESPRRRAKPNLRRSPIGSTPWSSRRRHRLGKPGVQGGDAGDAMSTRCASSSTRRKRRSRCSRTWSFRRCARSPRPRRRCAASRRRRARRPAPEAVPGPAGAPDLMLAEQLEALTGSVERLQAEVDALHGRAPDEHAPQDAERRSDESACRRCRHRGGLGRCQPRTRTRCCRGRAWAASYQPWSEGEPPRRAGAEPDAAAGCRGRRRSKSREVHFNSGSAELTPGGARVAREAVERIRSMEPATGAGGRLHGQGRRRGLQPGALEGARARRSPRCWSASGCRATWSRSSASGEEGAPGADRRRRRRAAQSVRRDLRGRGQLPG